MADQRLSLYSKKGNLLDRVQASFTFTEAINDFGNGDFTMAISDPKCTENNLSFGDYMLFEHARLGAWGGVMAPQNGQDWNDDKTITTRGFSAEFQFWRRRAPLHDLDFNDAGAVQGTDGAILKKLIRYANAEEDALLRPGKIFMGGETRRMKLRYAILGDLVSKIIERSEMEFWCTPYLEGKLLRFAVNLMPRRGRDLGYVLRERINLERPSGVHHRRDGEMVNDALVLAEGGDAPLKPTGERVHKTSRQKYGLWQGLDSVEGGSEAEAQSRANAIINETGLPQEKDKIVAIESSESHDTFRFVGLGDTVTVKKDTVVFYGSKRSYSQRKRIVAREYDSDVKKCILTMKNLFQACRQAGRWTLSNLPTSLRSRTRQHVVRDALPCSPKFFTVRNVQPPKEQSQNRTDSSGLRCLQTYALSMDVERTGIEPASGRGDRSAVRHSFAPGWWTGWEVPSTLTDNHLASRKILPAGTGSILQGERDLLVNVLVVLRYDYEPTDHSWSTTKPREGV